MRKITLLFTIAVLFSSCAALDYRETTYFADLRPYSTDGFFVTPALSVNEVYEPVSLLEIYFQIGYKDGVYYTPSYDEMLDKLVTQAKSVGANAILDFKIKSEFAYSKYGTSLNGYTASGYAVKMAGRPESIEQPVTDLQYDLQKALRLNKESNLPLIRIKGGLRTYLDPETGNYLDEKSFASKYGSAILFQLEKVSAIMNPGE